MSTPALAGAGSGVINLDQPGTYLHWSIFTVSVANLVLIAVMVIIFGVALVLPFPKGRTYPAEADLPAGADPGTLAGSPGRRGAADLGEDEDADMWSSRLRRGALRLLPPGKLLPDRQPAYVASWIYVFGVASLAALGVAIVSGFAIAIGGADWWHTNAVGHFFNSLHLWSVELFMALLVIHLWGKFWMAAWRGRRAMTWITGVVAFMASVVECFTGYLTQQNFDSQWISASAKDSFNSVGVGAFWRAMDFGQMLLWHVVLVPIALVAIVGAHVLLVRVRGVTHPLPAHLGGPGTGKERRRAQAKADAAPWRGRTRRYDIIKEGSIAAAGGAGADGAAGGAPVLARRALGHGGQLGQDRPGRLPGHRGDRTQRHQRHRDLRAALQQRHRRRAETAVRARADHRRHPADQHRRATS